jgi:spore maturation protein CgeB
LPHEQFVLAGSLYPRGRLWPDNVRPFDHIAPAEHPALYSSSRATLNITRGGMAQAGYCPSGRFFEAAACGTPIVSDYFEGLETFFTPGEEILCASNADDVVSALSQPAAKMNRIAEAARARTLREYTGENRAEELLGYLAEVSESRARSEVA